MTSSTRRSDDEGCGRAGVRSEYWIINGRTVLKILPARVEAEIIPFPGMHRDDPQYRATTYSSLANNK